MKRLREFTYHQPDTLAEAVGILVAEGDGARVLAGGTDLVVDMKIERVLPTAVVNLKRIPGLSGIEAGDQGTRIGALTNVTDIEASPVVRERHSALADAAAVLASPPVRAMATIGGNVGRASPASDLGPPLIALEATATIVGPDGPREEPIEDLYLGPGITTLAHHDIIDSISVPLGGAGTGSAHVKIGSRGGGTDIALVGVSAAVTVVPSGLVSAARIVLASVAPTPMRAVAAEQALVGSEPSESSLSAAGAAAAAECRPISDLRASATYRVALVKVLTVRALRKALAIAGEVS